MSLLRYSYHDCVKCREGCTKKPGFIGYDEAGHRRGNDLLSQGLSPHYHRRNSVSLPGSEWDRVVPPCYGHQRTRFMLCA